MAVNGRNKGSEYERHLCRLLSRWWFQQEFKGVPADLLPFRRTPGSGAWEHGGSDVRPVTDEDAADWPFCVEAKKREGWEWYTFVEGAVNHPILMWWKQCKDNSDRMGKLPLLIFTRNLRPDYFMMRRVIVSDLGIPVRVFLTNGGEHLAVGRLALLLERPPELVRVVTRAYSGMILTAGGD